MQLGVYLGAKVMIDDTAYTIVACHDKSGLSQYCNLMSESGVEREVYVKPEMLVEIH